MKRTKNFILYYETHEEFFAPECRFVVYSCVLSSLVAFVSRGCGAQLPHESVYRSRGVCRVGARSGMGTFPRLYRQSGMG